MKALSANYALAPNDLADALRNAITADQPVLVWGPPGVGKSDVARQVASDMDMEYIDIRALLLDPVDLRGIPMVVDGRTHWAPPVFLPPTASKKKYLINLDELLSALPLVLAALYQLTLDRKVGEYRLPEGARIMACSNRESDRGVVHRMPTPLASRFIHLEAKVDIEAWIEWALAHNLPVEVIFFLKFRPELLMQFDPKSAEKAFPCPRTWAFVAKLVAAGNRGRTAVDLAVLRGAIGEGPAIEFAAFLEVFAQLPAPDMVFNDPLGIDMPTDPSVLIALCGAVARQADQARMDALVAFGKRSDMRPEIAEFMINSAVKFNPTSRYTKAWVEWESYLAKL